MYLHAISGRSAKVCSFLARKFKKYVRGGTIKKGKKKAKGYETWRKGLTRQSRHVSMPLGGVHGMWSHQPSAFPPPFFAPLSPFLVQTGEFFYPCPSASSLSIFTPLRADQGTFHLTGWGTPDFEPIRPSLSLSLSLFTLVINTNCSIQTFEMCLTFLWHVIPSPLFPFPMLLSHFFCFSSYFSLCLHNATQEEFSPSRHPSTI